jgi:hypothetical protein
MASTFEGALTAFEREARDKALTEMPDEVRLAYRILELFIAGFNAVELGQKVVGYRRVIFSLAVHSFNTFRVAHEALLNGYPVQAIELARRLDEDLLTASYVEERPSEGRFFWAKKYEGKLSKKIPKFEDMRRWLEKQGPTGKKLMKHARYGYGAMSQVAHPRPAGLRLERRRTDEGADHYFVGGEFDGPRAMTAYYYLFLYGPMAAGLIGAFVRDRSWHEERQRVIGAAIEWLDRALARRTRKR